ncbi:putative reverse transcriptase domain-containing protein [Tanacetum coccineum]
MGDPRIFTLPCRLGDSKPFNTLTDMGSCVNIIPLYLFKKLNIRLLEETDHVFGLADGTKSYPVGIVRDVEVHIGKLKLLNDFYVLDMKKDPETPLLVGRGFLATANAVIDCRMAKIEVREGITRLYLMRRSLEVLRKFHWMILGGRFNQLSHVLLVNIGDNVQFKCRKAYLLEDKQISSVGVFDEVFRIWKAFGGNTRDLGSFGEETYETTDLHQHCSRIFLQWLETAS